MMITIPVKKIKSFSQERYNNFINQLHFHMLTCTCGHKGNFIKHDYYKRSVKNPEGSEVIRVLRVMCKNCGKTHAILPDWIVPYSKITLKYHIKIIQAYLQGKCFKSIMSSNPSIDESDVKYVVNQFRKHWLGRLAVFKIPLDADITKSCFEAFDRQFMQIKRTPNILFT